MTNELTVEQKAEIEDAVKTLVDDEWLPSTDPVDFAKLMSLVHNDEITEMAFNGGVVQSYAAMEAVFGEHFSSVSREPVIITDSKTVALTQDLVYVMRSGTFVSIDTAGNSGPVTPAVQTLLWVRHDGVWKMLLDTSLTDRQWKNLCKECVDHIVKNRWASQSLSSTTW